MDDCLICRSGRFELQSAPVDIDMAARINIRHCSIYDVPRAGINIGDGCWGGDVIEYCDVFDTVKETGDHGSFNSWGRDRYWGLNGVDLNKDSDWKAHMNLPFLDVDQPIILRNSRWRCDHGWDIDLDDGSSNYRIYNNLCLNGGIKNREGYGRVVENNVLLNNTFHPHVWFVHSGDIFRRNILCCDFYRPAGMPAGRPWGALMDGNFVDVPGMQGTESAVGLAAQSHRDTSSLIGDARFIDPAAGDFRVAADSPALSLGFVNFPMNKFGVSSRRLKVLARQPEIPAIVCELTDNGSQTNSQTVETVFGARVRDIIGLDDRSAYGLPSSSGVLILNVPAYSAAQRYGLENEDVIIAAGNVQVRAINDLAAIISNARDEPIHLTIVREQRFVEIDVRR